MLLPKDYVYPLFTVGRCYCLMFVVDVKTAFGRCYMPSGRWNSHYRVGGVVIGMLTGKWNSHGSV